MLRSILRSSPSAARRWSRHYSVKAEVASTAQPKDIEPAQLKITKTSKPGVLDKPENLLFGRKFSDHMITCEWEQTNGWQQPQIVPYQNLSMDQRGFSLYLRPTMIGTQKTLGVSPPGSAMLFVIASPVGPYYPTGFKAVSLEATDYAVRAWPGGAGDKKLGANYAPCIVPQREAMARGFQQNLWLFGEEEYVTEVGTMNMFVAIKNKQTGQKELLTAPLDGTILEGVTRDSILALARERLVPEGWAVSERKFTMKELHEASTEGRLIEAFGSGTAAIVSPVRSIAWKGKLVHCGLQDHEESGEIAMRMKGWIESIQYGDEDHEWSHVC